MTLHIMILQYYTLVECSQAYGWPLEGVRWRWQPRTSFFKRYQNIILI